MVQAPDDGSIRKRVAVALLSDERVLLIHRWRDGDEYYVVPGGGVEPGEAIEDAARRELREEASAVVDGKLTPLITFDGSTSATRFDTASSPLRRWPHPRLSR